MHGGEVFERLDTSWPRGLVKAGRFAEARQELAEALRRAGFECAPLEARTDDDMAAAVGAWVVLVGASMENGWSIYVVPSNGLDDATRGALETCHREVVTADTPFELPQLYAAFAHVAALASRVEWGDVELAIEGSPLEGVLDEDGFNAAFGAWNALRVRDGDGDDLAAKLDCRLEGIVEVYEML